MGWEQTGRERASKVCTIIAMRERAKWHREQAKDFLNNSWTSMSQHEREAEALETTASKLEQLEIARAGVDAGVFKALLEGYSLQKGSYIEVQTEIGWVPFWCEEKKEPVTAGA